MSFGIELLLGTSPGGPSRVLLNEKKRSYQIACEYKMKKFRMNGCWRQGKEWEWSMKRDLYFACFGSKDKFVMPLSFLVNDSKQVSCAFLCMGRMMRPFVSSFWRGNFIFLEVVQFFQVILLKYCSGNESSNLHCLTIINKLYLPIDIFGLANFTVMLLNSKNNIHPLDINPQKQYIC